MSKTAENLKIAFAGESQANRKYLAFAKMALSEGKIGLAKLFRAVAEGETIHALNHFRVMGEVKTSKENLEAAINGETYEIEEMYPQFIAEAKEEAESEALVSFVGAKKVEEVHQKLFIDALDKIKNGEDAEDVEYYVCQVCGNPEIGEAPDVCPVCGSPKEKFVKL